MNFNPSTFYNQSRLHFSYNLSLKEKGSSFLIFSPSPYFLLPASSSIPPPSSSLFPSSYFLLPPFFHPPSSPSSLSVPPHAPPPPLLPHFYFPHSTYPLSPPYIHPPSSSPSSSPPSSSPSSSPPSSPLTLLPPDFPSTQRLLSNFFKENRYPNRKELENLAANTKRPIRNLDAWFKNRRRALALKGELPDYKRKNKFSKVEARILREFFERMERPKKSQFLEIREKLNNGCTLQNIKNWWNHFKKKRSRDRETEKKINQSGNEMKFKFCGRYYEDQ